MNKSCYFILLFLLFGTKLYAQVPAWGGGADLSDISFGFHFQYISTNYKILKYTNWRQPYFDVPNNKYVTDSLNNVSSPNSSGFAVGFIARYRLTENLELRTTPSLAFTDRTLVYQFQTSTLNTTKQVSASLVEVPLSLKIKSDRIGNFRAYLLGGIKYSFGIAAAKKEDPNISPLDKVVTNQRSYASYEAGIGIDFYFEYFKFSPEIKISNSFGDVLAHTDNPYARPIDKLLLHSIGFSIYFE